MKQYYFIIVVAGVMALSLFALYFSLPSTVNQDENQNPVTVISTSTPTTATTTKPAATSSPAVKQYISYGNVTVKVGETVYFKNQSVTLVKVLSDSRCPTGVMCIWAGTVSAEVTIVPTKGTSTVAVELGKFVVANGLNIELFSVLPTATKDTVISQSAYRLTFNVIPESGIVVIPKKINCYIGGCSRELCTSRESAISLCMYKHEYQCYKSAVCEQQSNGECGWTETSALKACTLDVAQTR
jgi:hypothetical protein